LFPISLSPYPTYLLYYLLITYLTTYHYFILEYLSYYLLPYTHLSYYYLPSLLLSLSLPLPSLTFTITTHISLTLHHFPYLYLPHLVLNYYIYYFPIITYTPIFTSLTISYLLLSLILTLFRTLPNLVLYPPILTSSIYP
ncbi:uncharacterized protein VICG_02173, partial [Vittaforma corneae ATCC 50505]